MKKHTEFRRARERAGLTQEQVAERAGLSPRTVATADAGGKVSTKSSIQLRAALMSGAKQSSGLPAQPQVFGPVPSPEPEQQAIQISGRPVTVDTRRANDLPVISVRTHWDRITEVRLALMQLQEGQFFEAADIVEAMMADDRIKGLVSQRIDGLLGLPFKVDACEEDNTLAAELAEEVEDLWPRIASDEAIRDLWKWGRFLGVGLAEKIYDTESDDGWVPKLKVWHPRYFFWQADTRKLIVNTRDGPISIWPESDGVHSIETNPKTGKTEERVGHWVLYTPYGFERGWMEALIRPLAIVWLFRQFAFRDWGRSNEAYGMPIRGLIEPAEAPDADKQNALQQVARIASDCSIRLPQDANGYGYDLKLIEATAQTYESFKLSIEEANSSMAILILGQNLSSEVKGGSFSAAQVHERVAASIIESDNKTLSTTFRSQVLLEWAALNHGPQASAMAPCPGWDTEPPEDKGARATAFLTAAQGLATLRKTQMPFDYAKTCKEQGLHLDPTQPIPDFVPPPPPTPFGGKGPDDEEDDEPDVKQAKGKNLQARIAAVALREHMVTAKMGRRDRAPLQGQVYADQLTDAGREEAARILTGDVRALRKIIANAKAGPDGKIDAQAIREELLKAYRDMEPDKLARVLANCKLLAELSGRYAITKEVVSE